MKFSFVLFLLVFLAVYLGMHLYVLSRIAGGLLLGRGLRIGLEILFLLGASAFFAGEMLSRHTAAPAIKPLISFGTVWLGVIAMAFTLFVAADLVRLFFPGPVFRHHATVTVLVLLALMTGWSLINVATRRGVREITLTVPRLNPAHAGFTIVQLSDIHINAFSSPAWVAEIVAQANALHPDLIVITGDLLDADICRLGGFCPLLQGLTAKYGVYAISGNHEYYTGLDVFAAVVEALKDENKELKDKLRLLESEDKIICPICNSDEHLSFDICLTKDDTPYDIAFCEKCGEIAWEEEH
jgi:hypothetical protein